ncbi:TfoX/Sxy family protein [Leptospira sarikeiensis]|uniref:TfoX family protein n=1 Tax=Leptospira sarikeiensis TaxID=2484943 RepID=A0A4R9JZI9_9LEPT|nr:TfoX/Sxy family protein [Leptospira sarikeiensis]TGL57671.1 TfoX family protein [Leptospira sarikeiensis]
MSSFLDYIEDRLSTFGPVLIKPMFGGYGVYSGSTIFGLISDDILYFKVGPGNKTDYEAAGMSPFVYEAKQQKRIAMSYWQVPEEILENPDDLREWILKSLAESKKSKSPKKKTAAKKKVKSAKQAARKKIKKK